MIREAKPSDYESMDSVFRASAKKLCTASYDKEVIEAWAGKSWPERFVKGAKEGNNQYVLLKDDVVVCFGSINLEKKLLVSLFVSPEFVGQGVGQIMIEFLLDMAKSKGVEVLHLDSSLNAVNFYSRNGFKEKARCKYKTQNGVLMESVQMECSL
ncbi:GNAT family N-acetyltransferase [Rheinheimera baltica]|uniref:GNAT family N-acetyltransferase n=1 Tax=Rheinheimera baltica TaxID=67576 RepID=UPI00273CF5D2|nr:GNAT family N-acetyltransferase [Rheinheimera baltica]MDP5188907.1 GNAT family N-acetyltransferase [Rheinheimera baltica]